MYSTFYQVLTALLEYIYCFTFFYKYMNILLSTSYYVGIMFKYSVICCAQNFAGAVIQCIPCELIAKWYQEFIMIIMIFGGLL